MAETRKALQRRLREGFFERHVRLDLPGIDIGCGKDPLNQVFRRYDKEHGDTDAQLMEGVPDNAYSTVYASHILEHLDDPQEALKNWYRILAPGGHLIVIVPHADLYEKKRELPSKWNEEHKTMWLRGSDEGPVKGLTQTIASALPESLIIYVKTCSEGYEPNGDSHASGEYSIEAVVRKPRGPEREVRHGA
jgi:SAM-dependent methyltransferase